MSERNSYTPAAMAVDTVIMPNSAEAIAEAARRILAGECVAVPTETVYGLAADATNGEAVARIYEAKGRPSFNPLIVHVGTIDMARDIADFSPTALGLAEAFWPGPLTMVLPHREDSPIADIVTAGLPTIALRLPSEPTMRRLLSKVGKPLAAPSANASGQLSPTLAAHVEKSLGGRIGLIVDTKHPPHHGLESTIVAVREEGIELLRAGPITVEQIGAVTGTGVSEALTGKIEAPGQLLSHYAPSKPLRLNAIDADEDEYHLGFGEIGGDSSLSLKGNLEEAASLLFDALHFADASDRHRIAVAPIPETGIGVAINDRLRRAAAGSAG